MNVFVCIESQTGVSLWFIIYYALHNTIQLLSISDMRTILHEMWKIQPITSLLGSIFIKKTVEEKCDFRVTYSLPVRDTLQHEYFYYSVITGGSALLPLESIRWGIRI